MTSAFFGIGLGIVTPRGAALLDRRFRFDDEVAKLLEAGDFDPEELAALDTLRRAALAGRLDDEPVRTRANFVAVPCEPPSSWSCSSLAAAADVTKRCVQRAIDEGRLAGVKNDRGNYVIEIEEGRRWMRDRRLHR